MTEAAKVKVSEVLTTVLRAVCMPPLELYPADGSPDRRPPVTVRVKVRVRVRVRFFGMG